MIVERRTFQAKVGQAGAVVQKLKEFERETDRFGVHVTRRIFTDFLSGATDRVVWEWEVESLSKYETTLAEVMQNPEALQAYETWFEGLKPLIDGATVELWRGED